MKLLAMPLLLSSLALCGSAASAAEPLRVLRVGDSITRLTATNPVFAERLAAAGLKVDFVGAQKPAGEKPGLDTDCEGYNGRPIEFFTKHQATYGDEPFSDGCPMADAVPLRKALADFKPQVVVAMVGVNNLAGKGPEIDAAGLTAKLEEFCDKLEQWLPAGAKVVLSTVPPANDAMDPQQPHRNQRHRLYNEQVVRPLAARRIAAGKPYTLADPEPVMLPADIKDLVHPNDAGKTKLNTAWAAAVLKALGKTKAPASTSS